METFPEVLIKLQSSVGFLTSCLENVAFKAASGSLSDVAMYSYPCPMGRVFIFPVSLHRYSEFPPVLLSIIFLPISPQIKALFICFLFVFCSVVTRSGE